MVIGERQKLYLLIQKYFEGEMRGFVGGTGHHEIKSLQVVQTSYAWRNDSTITFRSFANEIKASYRN